MGHTTNPHREHVLLRERYDRMVTGAPDSPHIMKILAILFSPEEARLARQLPARPTALSVLARRTGMDADALDAKLTDMAHRGLILDFTYKNRRYFMLPPVVIGFFEFVFMRTRDELPMKELAELFDAYMYDDNRFAANVFGAQTQIGRAMTHEEALAGQDFSEILDWERATRVIEKASAVGVSMCACRHKKLHHGDVCDAPMDVCFSLNQAADTLARNGMARLVDKHEAMALLEQSKQAGLVQVGDNVQRNMTYMCNCCGCCCTLMKAMHTMNMQGAVMSTRWVMRSDAEKCTGCGICVKTCPVQAIHLEPESAPGGTRSRAVVNTELCLGCGVCYSRCRKNAIGMVKREKQTFTPEDFFEKAVHAAIERGKLSDLIFDMPEKLSHRALYMVMSALEKSPPGRAAMAIRPLRSAFMNAALKGHAKTS